MPRALVVDDEPEGVELLQEFLTAKGYEVLTAAGHRHGIVAHAPKESEQEAARISPGKSFVMRNEEPSGVPRSWRSVRCTLLKREHQVAAFFTYYEIFPAHSWLLPSSLRACCCYWA